MSLGEDDARFPGSGSGLPPSPSPENPGQVYPRSDLQAAPAGSIPGTGGKDEPTSFMGNPYALDSVFNKLDEALNDAISIIESEERSSGSTADERAAVQKLKGWRLELVYMRTGHQKPIEQSRRSETTEEGGMFTD